MDILYLAFRTEELLEKAHVAIEAGRKPADVQRIQATLEEVRSFIREVQCSIKDTEQRYGETQTSISCIQAAEDLLDSKLCPVRHRLYGILYYHANKERLLCVAAQWQEDNKDKRRKWRSKRVAIDKAQRRARYIRDKNKKTAA